MSRYTTRRQFLIAPGPCLVGAIFWNYFAYFSNNLFHTPLFYALALGFGYLTLRLYRGVRIAVSWDREDGIALGGFLGIALLAHWPYLFYSVAGDELYHAEHASLLLTRVYDWVAGWPRVALETHRASLWALFDLRHLNQIDLHRILTIMLILVIWGVTKLRGPTAWAILAVLVAFLARVFGEFDFHPPLRLLLPFLTHHLFGLNAFGFRIASLLVAVFVSLFVYRMLRAEFARLPRWWVFTLSLAPLFIPVVFYVSNQFEPSIYGYATTTAALLISWRLFQKETPSDAILLGLIVGLGTLCRNPMIAIWPAVAVVIASVPTLRTPKLLLQTFFPLLLAGPFFYALTTVGHAALAKESATALFTEAIVSGRAVMTLLNSFSLPWILFSIVVLIGIVGSLSRRERALYLFALPLLGIFFKVAPLIQGSGRYQAEYAAPFLVLTLFYFAPRAGERARRMTAGVLLFLSFVTLELAANLSLDINYDLWGQMRVSTAASFPYREALSDLKRDEAEGHFLLLGGQPWYGRAVTWFGGFSIQETATWRLIQDHLEEELRMPSPQRFDDFLRKYEVKNLLIQKGTRRERQHLTNFYAELIRYIESQPRKFRKVREYSGEHGGRLELYERISPDQLALR